MIWTKFYANLLPLPLLDPVGATYVDVTRQFFRRAGRYGRTCGWGSSRGPGVYNLGRENDLVGLDRVSGIEAHALAPLPCVHPQKNSVDVRKE